MFDMKILKENDCSVLFEVLIKPSDLDDFDRKWGPVLKKLSKSDKKVIFKIEEIDRDGIVLTLFHTWLELSPKVYIQSSMQRLKETLRLLYNDRVVFIDEGDQ